MRGVFFYIKRFILFQICVDNKQSVLKVLSQVKIFICVCVWVQSSEFSKILRILWHTSGAGKFWLPIDDLSGIFLSVAFRKIHAHSQRGSFSVYQSKFYAAALTIRIPINIETDVSQMVLTVKRNTFKSNLFSNIKTGRQPLRYRSHALGQISTGLVYEVTNSCNQFLAIFAALYGRKRDIERAVGQTRAN